MADDLTSHTTGLGQTKTEHNVVQTQLQQAEHVVTGDALHVGGLQVVLVELLFQDAVYELNLLLFLQLGAVFGDLLAAVSAGIAGGFFIAIAHNGRGNVELPAFLGNRIFIHCHFCLSSFLHATAFGRTATVVRNGRHVLDHVHIQTGGLKRTDSGFASGTGAFDIHFNRAQTVFHSGLGSGLSGHLSSEGRGLLASAEAQTAGAGPGKSIALGVGDGHDGIVERRTDMGSAALNELPFAAFTRSLLQLLLRCH